MKPNKELIFIFIFSILLLGSHSAVFEGSLKTTSKWHFLAKFCFSDDFGGLGTLYYNITTPNALKIALYLGTTNYSIPGAWGPVYDNSETWPCQKLLDAKRVERDVKSGEAALFEPRDIAHAYFWYIAVADCGSSGISIDYYNITFINPGGLWYAQVSYDEQGVCEYYIFFFIVYALLFAVHLWGVYQLVHMKSFHPIIRLLTISIGFAFLSTLCEMIHYIIFLYDGIGVPGLLGLGELLTMAAQLLLMFLCILIAKGLAITTSYLTDRNILVVVLALFVLAYLALFIWDNAGRDPASTLYFYDSIPGIIVIVLRLALTGWFLWCLRSTIKLEILPEKKTFYTIFGACYALWFLMLPAIVVFALILDPWYRFRTVKGMILCMDVMAYISLILLLWPTRAAKYFNITPTPLMSSAGSTYGTTGEDDRL